MLSLCNNRDSLRATRVASRGFGDLDLAGRETVPMEVSRRAAREVVLSRRALEIGVPFRARFRSRRPHVGAARILFQKRRGPCAICSSNVT